MKSVKGKMSTLARVVKCGAPRVPELAGCAYISKRHNSVTSGNYKRGTGGRSSFSGTVATVFGAKSTMGYYVVNRLGKVGSQVIIPYRGDPIYMRDFKLMGDLGQILFNPIDVNDEESLRKSMQYSDIVINLIGTEFETRNYSFHDVHVETPRKIARIAKEYGIEKFVHVSALNAGKKSSNIIRDGSQYLKTKLEGEEAVREEFPEAIIMRPAALMDLNDKFMFYYTKNYRYYFELIPLGVRPLQRNISLWHHGKDTIRMPIRAKDVSQGIINALKDPEAAGKTFQCVGPCAYTLEELVQYIYTCRRMNVRVNASMSRIKLRAFLMEKMFRKVGVPLPKVTLDMLERESISDELDPSLPTLQDLGVTPENIEDVVSFVYGSYRNAGIFQEALGLVSYPEKPPSLFATLR